MDLFMKLVTKQSKLGKPKDPDYTRLEKALRAQTIVASAPPPTVTEIYRKHWEINKAQSAELQADCG